MRTPARLVGGQWIAWRPPRGLGCPVWQYGFDTLGGSCYDGRTLVCVFAIHYIGSHPAAGLIALSSFQKLLVTRLAPARGICTAGNEPMSACEGGRPAALIHLERNHEHRFHCTSDRHGRFCDRRPVSRRVALRLGRGRPARAVGDGVCPGGSIARSGGDALPYHPPHPRSASAIQPAASTDPGRRAHGPDRRVDHRGARLASTLAT